ncbi:unnamed protein product [Coffea canephora]|uniref:Carbamoyl-phosphate synthetase large subunit oligomerisation domain-containing protein n=1 Tax=Coffea canephora TaxID=49390 RepID=A0A068UK64_COFCA|nr:unnamed protein product [Coffea canephora]
MNIKKILILGAGLFFEPYIDYVVTKVCFHPIIQNFDSAFSLLEVHSCCCLLIVTFRCDLEGGSESLSELLYAGYEIQGLYESFCTLPLLFSQSAGWHALCSSYNQITVLDFFHVLLWIRHFSFSWKMVLNMQILCFAIEKFPGSEPILTTQMKSVGGSMAVGQTWGWGCAQIKELDWDWDWDCLRYSLRVPSPDCIHTICVAMKRGMKVNDIRELSYIDKWFLTQLKELIDVEQYLLSQKLSDLTKDDLYEVKKRGFIDKEIAFATKITEKEVWLKWLSLGVKPAYKRVDTCAAEFEAQTPYMYSSYDFDCESAPTQRKKDLILGGGPNQIDQGIEFDNYCSHISFTLQIYCYETIMMNSNPKTVSIDYGTSDCPYFEPLTVEDVLNVIDLEGPDGIIVQFGGQTPMKLALPTQQCLDEQKPKCKSGAVYVGIWGT